MRPIHLSLLGVCSFVLLGATCVGAVRQRGDAGPWTGEVTNTGGQAVYGVSAVARIIDADGADLYGRVGVFACPSKLLPGERGAFALYASNPDWVKLPGAPEEPRLPLRAEFDALAHENVGTGQARGDGLWVEERSRNAAARTIDVRLHNNGEGGARQYTVCAVVYADDGTVTAVARADGEPLPHVLSPGQYADLTLDFDAAIDGEVRYYALGLLDAPYAPCCPLGATEWRSVDTGPFRALLPPGWVYVPAQGIDSLVGSFEGDGARLSFDFGLYSGFPGERAASHKETIGGVTADIVPVDAAGITGIYFDRVRGERIANDAFDVRLSVGGEGLTPEQRAIALQIFRSIRFDPPPR